MRFTIYQESRQGGRANNEDRTTYCYSRDALMMAVADGMGGRSGGRQPVGGVEIQPVEPVAGKPGPGQHHRRSVGGWAAENAPAAK